MFRAKLAEAMGRLQRVSAAYQHGLLDGLEGNKENVPDPEHFQRWLADRVGIKRL